MSYSGTGTHTVPPHLVRTWPRIIFASLLMIVMVLGCVGWAATADLSGAVIAPGSVMVERRLKKIQHREGGIVSQLLVREGQSVAAGEVLIRLDETQTRAELAIIRNQLAAQAARISRLYAERAGLDSVVFQTELIAMGPDAAAIMDSEVRAFDEARKTRKGQKEQLESRISQLQDEIEGLELQRDARGTEIELIRKELATVESLQQRQLTPISRVYAMEREATRLGGERGSFIAQIARAEGQISELRLQIINLDQTAKSEAQKEAVLVETRVAELSERRIAAEDRLKRMELRAPQAGVVHELAVHTIGGVITPAEPILFIVPENEALSIEIRVSPTDIDQVAIGQSARLRFTAFNQRTTPEIPARVSRVSADVTRDVKAGVTYYSALVEPVQPAGGESIKLVPGMPVEAYISTGERTALTYLLKPITDQFSRAFKEE